MSFPQGLTRTTHFDAADKLHVPHRAVLVGTQEKENVHCELSGVVKRSDQTLLMALKQEARMDSLEPSDSAFSAVIAVVARMYSSLGVREHTLRTQIEMLDKIYKYGWKEVIHEERWI